MKKILTTSFIAMTLMAIFGINNPVMADNIQNVDLEQNAIAGCSNITTGAYGQIICTPIINQNQEVTQEMEVTETTNNYYQQETVEKIVYVEGERLVVKEHIPVDTALDFKSSSVAVTTALSGVAAFIAKIKDKFIA